MTQHDVTTRAYIWRSAAALHGFSRGVSVRM